MRIILRPGHGLTAPAGPEIKYSKAGRWIRQRPGNKEDDWTAQYCANYLIPALVAAGHSVYPLRALDPVTGELDETQTTVGPDQLPGLTEDQAITEPRWLFNASVEGALRGIRVCRNWPGSPWVHDPVAACQWEAAIPDESAAGELYLSIHQNWFGRPKMYGFNAMYYGKPWPSKHCSRIGKSIATSIWDRVLDAFDADPWIEETKIADWHDRHAFRIKTGSRFGCEPSLLWEIRKTRRPAVLLEMAFASNADDKARMSDPTWCSTMAEMIAIGIHS